jgi:hypothetical protein
MSLQYLDDTPCRRSKRARFRIGGLDMSRLPPVSRIGWCLLVGTMLFLFPTAARATRGDDDYGLIGAMSLGLSLPGLILFLGLVIYLSNLLKPKARPTVDQGILALVLAVATIVLSLLFAVLVSREMKSFREAFGFALAGFFPLLVLSMVTVIQAVRVRRRVAKILAEDV